MQVLLHERGCRIKQRASCRHQCRFNVFAQVPKRHDLALLLQREGAKVGLELGVQNGLFSRCVLSPGPQLVSAGQHRCMGSGHRGHLLHDSFLDAESPPPLSCGGCFTWAGTIWTCGRHARSTTSWTSGRSRSAAVDCRQPFFAGFACVRISSYKGRPVCCVWPTSSVGGAVQSLLV